MTRPIEKPSKIIKNFLITIWEIDLSKRLIKYSYLHSPSEQQKYRIYDPISIDYSKLKVEIPYAIIAELGQDEKWRWVYACPLDLTEII